MINNAVGRKQEKQRSQRVGMNDSRADERGKKNAGRGDQKHKRAQHKKHSSDQRWPSLQDYPRALLKRLMRSRNSQNTPGPKAKNITAMPHAIPAPVSSPAQHSVL